MTRGTPTLAFVGREWRFLLFGALLMFWTSPGQTYLMGLFGEDLRRDFGLGHGAFGALYTAATVVSAAMLWPAGRLVDRLRLGRFAWWVCAAIAIATAAMALVSGLVSLFFGILAVRFLGQGMMAHIATTAMARRYEAERGRAVAITGFGFPISQAVLPPLITVGLTVAPWQQLWIALGAALAVTLLPTLPFLLKCTAGQDSRGPDALIQSEIGQRQWTRAEMPRDRRFPLIVPMVMTMPALYTGVIFHQKHLIAVDKGWDFLWWSLCFTGYAVAQVGGGFLAGWLVDRASARRFAPWMLTPFAVSMVLLAAARDPAWAPVVLVAMGLSGGAINPALAALWAEL